jgi:hypothetical protein
MVSSRRIDANPKKVKAIEKLQPPQTRKEIQKLAGMIQKELNIEDLVLKKDIRTKDKHKFSTP